MANPFEIAVPNVLQALMAGNEAFKQTRGYRKEEALSDARTRAANAMRSGGDQKSYLADLMAAGDVEGMKALGSIGDNSFDRQYKLGMLDIARKASERKEVPPQVQVLNAAGIDPRSPEGRKALFPRTDPPLTVSDRKAINSAEEEVLNLGGTVEQLDRALKLNDKTFSGAGAEARAWIGSKLPDRIVPDWIADKAGADATTEWGKIMAPVAIEKMGDTLKGATTDFELRKYVGILADPSTAPDIRKRTLEQMKTLAQRKAELSQTRLQQLRTGEYYKPGGGMTGQAQQPPMQGAKQASDGNWYVPNPDMPGKFLKVVP